MTAIRSKTGKSVQEISQSFPEANYILWVYMSLGYKQAKPNCLVSSIVLDSLNHLAETGEVSLAH